jgi:hypothetical protein
MSISLFAHNQHAYNAVADMLSETGRAAAEDWVCVLNPRYEGMISYVALSGSITLWEEMHEFWSF